MNETIPLVAFNDASHEQIRTLTNRLDELLLSEKTAHPILTDQISDAKEALATHEKVLNRPLGDPLTVVTQGDDAKRDKGTRAFLSKIYTAAEDLDDTISIPAKAIKSICVEFGGKGITSIKLAEQTDMTSRLVSRLKEPANSATIEFLGFTKDLETVDTLNNTFENSWKQRAIDNPEAALIPLMKEVRGDINNTLSVFSRTLSWLQKKGKTGLPEATLQAIRKYLQELSSDLKMQATVEATAIAKAKALEPTLA